MEELRLKIDNEIRELIKKINNNSSKEEIKKIQLKLNGLLKEYLEEK